MSFEKVEPGQWVQPRRRRYLIKCCDCGLVHRLNFRLVKHGRGFVIQFQAFRHPRPNSSGRLRKKGKR